MTTELDIARQDGHAEIVPVRPKAGTAAAAMDMLREHAEMMRMAFDLATAMVGTTMVPKIYQRKSKDDKDAANNATAAILYGLELGLNPIQSLQQVFSVNNSPAIYARTMVALLKSKGYKFRTDEAGPERCTVTAWWPGEEPETSTWDIERAMKAGFIPTVDPQTGKYKTKKFTGPNGPYEKLIGNEKYLTQPEEMLWAKAASTVCRRLAPDALLGIGRTVEDLESEPEPDPVRVRSERVQVAEILDQAAESEPPKVQQWQAPAEDSGSTAVVSQPEPENPESDSSGTKQAAKAPAAEPKKTAAKKAPAKPKVQPGGVTPQALEEISSLLDELHVPQDNKRPFIAEFFKRPIADVRELTPGEGKDLIGELRAMVAEPAADAQLPMDAAEGGE